MAHVVHRKRGSKVYSYLEESYRNAEGKPRKRVIGKLGVIGGQKRKRLTVGDVLGQLLRGGATLGMAAAMGKTRPQYQASKGKTGNGLDRPRQIRDAALRALDSKWSIDLTNADTFHQSRAHMTKATMREYWMEQRAIHDAYRAAHGRTTPPPAPKSAEMREFEARINAVRAKPDEPKAAKSYPPKDTPTPEEEAKHVDNLAKSHDYSSQAAAEHEAHSADMEAGKDGNS